MPVFVGNGGGGERTVDTVGGRVLWIGNYRRGRNDDSRGCIDIAYGVFYTAYGGNIGGNRKDRNAKATAAYKQQNSDIPYRTQKETN